MLSWIRKSRVWWGLLPLLAVGAEPVLELAPYTVEARHFDGLAMEVPAGVIRLERSAIEASGAGNVPELLERLAGVRVRQVTATGTEGQLAMRGFGDNSGLRVLVLLDGQVFNPADMGGINWAGLTLDQLETVEVLRGGQTVLYGNHAVSGVVKLRTREPLEALEGQAGAEAGSYGSRRVSLSAGSRMGVLYLRAGGFYNEADGYREHSDNEGWGAHLAWGVATGGEAHWKGRISQDWSEILFPGPLSYEAFLEDPRQSGNAGNDRSSSREWQATLHGEGKSDWGDWQLDGGWIDRSRRSDLDGIHADNQQQRLSLSPRARFGNKEDFLIAGLDANIDSVRREGFLREERAIRRSWADLERITLGGYTYASLSPGEGWILSGGVRAEKASTDNLHIRYKEEQLRPVLETNRGPVPNPAYRDPPEVDPDASFDGVVNKSGVAAEVSILKRLSEGFHLWAGWDRVYRYPALDEAGAYQGFPLSDPLNEDLDPETGDNFEIGLKRFGVNWHFSLTAFLLYMDGEIAYDEVERLNVNIGDTRRQGMEMDVSYQADHYGLTLFGSMLEASFRDRTVGAAVPLVPELEVGGNAWLKIAGDLRLQIHARYVDTQFQGNDVDNELQPLPGYGLVDLALYWKPNEGLAVTAGINNLFDRAHIVSAYSGGFYPGAGRHLFLRVTHAF